jgi:hypothetical protein
MVSRRKSSLFMVLGIVFLALVVLPGSVTAASIPYAGPHSGNYGAHWLRDSPEYRGVKCFYKNTSVLYRLRIRAPVVQAFDRTGGTDAQVVGWKFRVEYSDNTPTDWYQLYLSPITKASAKETQAANFTARFFDFGTVNHDYYRGRIKMFWFYPNATTIDGRADHWVQYYEGLYQNGTYDFVDWCSGVLV